MSVHPVVCSVVCRVVCALPCAERSTNKSVVQRPEHPGNKRIPFRDFAAYVRCLLQKPDGWATRRAFLKTRCFQRLQGLWAVSSAVEHYVDIWLSIQQIATFTQSLIADPIQPSGTIPGLLDSFEPLAKIIDLDMRVATC